MINMGERIGWLLMLWAFAAVLCNPYFERRWLAYVSVALGLCGSLLLTVCLGR